MMLVLGLETATAACTVAVNRDGETLAELTLTNPRAHSVQLMPLIQRCLEKAGADRRDLGAVAAGIGPGSFTGLRIGLATAKALGYALRIRAVGVATLDSMAFGARAAMAPGGLIVPMLDAKRDQVYTAIYDADPEQPQPAPPQLVALAELCEQLQATGKPVLVLGDGASSLKPQVAAKVGVLARFATPDILLPRGSAVAELGRRLLLAGAAGAPEALAPLYLRRAAAEEVHGAAE